MLTHGTNPNPITLRRWMAGCLASRGMQELRLAEEDSAVTKDRNEGGVKEMKEEYFFGEKRSRFFL